MKKLPSSTHKSIKSSTPQDLIESGFYEIEKQVKSELIEKLKTIDPYYFQKVILLLLKKMGYGDFIETSKSGDGGIDGIINEDKLGLEKIYIQAKRYTENKVREKDIRNFIGAMSGDTSKGVFVTTTSFDDQAIKKASDAHHTIILIDGMKLVELMFDFNVGIQVKEVYEVKEIMEHVGDDGERVHGQGHDSAQYSFEGVFCYFIHIPPYLLSRFWYMHMALYKWCGLKSGHSVSMKTSSA